jgi:hypothetical protein
VEACLERDITWGWLARKDSNLRSPDPESGALPLGHSPVPERSANLVRASRLGMNQMPIPNLSRMPIRNPDESDAHSGCAESTLTLLLASTRGADRWQRTSTPSATGLNMAPRDDRVRSNLTAVASTGGRREPRIERIVASVTGHAAPAAWSSRGRPRVGIRRPLPRPPARELHFHHQAEDRADEHDPGEDGN